MAFGKIVRESEKEIVIEDRAVLVRFIEFESGLQRVSVRFLDMGRSWLTKRNMELTRKVRELKEELKNKND